MRNYCSLTDSKYLPQLLVLYESLKKHSTEPFMLHVLALDVPAYYDLINLELPDVDVHSVFETGADMGIAAISPRTYREWCWTLASQFSEWLLCTVRYPEITYLDADMMFFSDPKVIFDEMGDSQIAVIPHRFIPAKQHLVINGKFNVSWVTFRGEVGRECCARWAAQCRVRCSETEGCGDQAYLDEWPELYKKDLYVIKNIGAGLAPWNLANYELSVSEGKIRPSMKGCIYVSEPADEYGYEYTSKVVFYHYHEYLHGQRLTNYALRPEDIELIYKPYIASIEEVTARMRQEV